MPGDVVVKIGIVHVISERKFVAYAHIPPAQRIFMKKTVIPAALPAEVRADVGCSCRNADTVVKSYSVVEAEVKDAGA
jgi:hypothetical protein